MNFLTVLYFASFGNKCEVQIFVMKSEEEKKPPIFQASSAFLFQKNT